MQAVNFFNSPVGAAFGHYQEASGDPLDFLLSIIVDVGNLIGYFPIISLPISFIRVSSAVPKLILPDPRFMDHKARYITLIVRGTLEFFCLGCLFLIPDIIFTFGRIFSPPRFS